MTALDLKAIRARAAGCMRVAVHTRDELDRAQLLALIDRMTPYLAHAPLCKAHLPIPRCDCGLDEIKREVGG